MTKAEEKELDAANKLSEKGRWDEAIAKLEVLQSSTDSETHDLALNYLADAYEANGRHADAEAMLRRSMEERGAVNDGLGTQLAVLAPVVRRQGRNVDAEALYLPALEIQKSDEPELRVITLRNLAYLYWTMGQPDQARNVLDQRPDCDEGFLEFLSGLLKPYLEPEIPG
jgi:tetratricopeptide (TPR) repeat protein